MEQEEMIAIPVSEYEHLKACKRRLTEFYESMQAELRNDLHTQRIHEIMADATRPQPVRNLPEQMLYNQLSMFHQL